MSKQSVYQQGVGVLASTSFLDHFEELEDPRLDRQKYHSLMDILFIAVCAVICGATSFVDMSDFGKAKIDWFTERLDLPNGIPSHDTFGRVFSLIDSEELGSALPNGHRPLARVWAVM